MNNCVQNRMRLKRSSLAAVFFATSALLFTSCASKSDTNLTAVEKVERVKASVDKTDSYIAEAENNIQELEKSLASIRKDAMESKEMRGKETFRSTLTSLSNKIAEAKLDLNRLRNANRDSFATFKNSIDSARSVMDESFRDSTEPREGTR